MIAKLITIASDRLPPDTFLIVILKEPLLTSVTEQRYPAEAFPAIAITGISVLETVLLSTVNETTVKFARAALFIVISPVMLLTVTVVDLLVACVCALPAPEVYPIPDEPEEVIPPVTAREVPVAVPIFGVVSTGLVAKTTLPLPVEATLVNPPEPLPVRNDVPVVGGAKSTPEEAIDKTPVVVVFFSNPVPRAPRN